MRFFLPILLSSVSLSALPSALAQCPPAAPASPPWLAPPSAPFAHHLALPSGTVSAHVYVDPSNDDVALGRPFVFVEGIDFGLGSDSPPYQQGDFGWPQLHGCDPDHYPMMAHMPVLLDSIRHRGFTPVLVDFGDGTALLENNAHLLADILRHLRDHRTDTRPMAIAGASMGGQLARMALRELEMSDELHCHQLFISLDSPHHGANIPLGLQHLLHGANHFGVWSSHWAEGTVDLSCIGSGLDWDISGQSWNWPVGWPQIQTGLQAVGTNGSCLINAVDMSPVPLQECRAGGTGKKE